MFAKVTRIIGSAAAVLGLVFSVSSPAQADVVTSRTFFWVSTLGDGLGIFKGDWVPDGSATPVAVSPNTASGHVWRDITTDGTRLYFADNNVGSNWDLASSKLDGTDHQVITSGIATPSYLQIKDDRLFYTTWTGGLFAVPVTGGTPTEIIGQTNTAGLGGSVPTYGYGSFTWIGSDVYIDVYDSGIIKAAYSAGNASAATVLTPQGYSALSATSWLNVGTDASTKVLVGGFGFTGFKSTANFGSAVSNWTSIATDFPGSTSTNAYRMVADADYVFYTNCSGDIYYRTTDGTGFGSVLANRFNNENYGITLVEQTGPAPVVEPLANTGSDLNLLWAGLGLLAVGSALTFRRKN